MDGSRKLPRTADRGGRVKRRTQQLSLTMRQGRELPSVSLQADDELIPGPSEYLTGFSKRKKERTEAARARAVEREKVEKRELRKQVCLPRSTR